MKRLKGLDEIHEIMEKIYEEEKGLSTNQRVKKLRDESDKFMLERIESINLICMIIGYRKSKSYCKV